MDSQFENFYKQQIRKDLIDKLNVCQTLDVDFSCVLSYKGYITSVPSDRNFKIISSIALAYLYILESFLCQKVVQGMSIQKNIQRDLPSTYFFNFSCTLRKNKFIFQFLQRLFVFVYFQRKTSANFHGSKPMLKFFFDNNSVLLKNLRPSLAPWIKNFRVLEKHNKLFSMFQFSCKNPFLFYWVFARLQLASLVPNNVYRRFLVSSKPAIKLSTLFPFAKTSKLVKKKLKK